MNHKNKIIKSGLTLILLLSCLFLFLQNNSKAAVSPDAIAIRVMPNINHYSPLLWYENNIKLKGSPQNLLVDGYEAVRDGRTVYVNAANISDNIFYTNIYIISYNQEAEDKTTDIFGQILSHWKFNDNITGQGNCSKTVAQSCLYNDQCPPAEYCTSAKAKIIRDVRRLSDLALINGALEVYKADNQSYPALEAGSYLPGRTLSVWPSWQKTLAQELKIALPEDPQNQIGPCSPGNFDAQTCWDDNKKIFDGDPPDDIPVGSRLYTYKELLNGQSYKLCTQFESGYNGLPGSCSESALPNNPPQIISVSLVGRPLTEFKGYVQAYDPDQGDILSWSIEFADPAAAGTWQSALGWQWETGKDRFSIKNIPSLPSQKQIYALKAGYLSDPGSQKIKIIVRDNRGGQGKRIYGITLVPYDMTIVGSGGSIIIGSEANFPFSGNDASNLPLEKISITGGEFGGSALSAVALGNYGFSVSGINVKEKFKSAQKTGAYIINVETKDPRIPALKAENKINVKVVNHPPKITGFNALFANSTNQTCDLNGEPCSFAINNGEKAKVQISASDSDPGHTLSYSLTGTPPAGLSINSATGLISGFDNLNVQGLTAQNYTLNVIAEDQYCNNSTSPGTECRDGADFSMAVLPYCGPEDANSYLQYEFEGDILNLTIPPLSGSGPISFSGLPGGCSELSAGTVEMELKGEYENKNLIFVVDISGSMAQTPPGETSSAIDLLKAKLKNIFTTLYNIAQSAAQGGKGIHVSLIIFNGYARVYSNTGSSVNYSSSSMSLDANKYVFDMFNDTLKNRLNTIVDRITADGGTNTIDALNLAEVLLKSGMPSGENTLVLLSDGKPEVLVTDVAGGCRLYCKPECNCGTPGLPGPPGPTPTYNHDPTEEADFKIATTDSDCVGIYNFNTPEQEEECREKKYDPPSDCLYYTPTTEYNPRLCTITNVRTQASSLKSLPNLKEIYTAYYQTQVLDTEYKKSMCQWSSEPIANCNPYAPENYALSGSNIDIILDNLIYLIMGKPSDIEINSWSIEDLEKEFLESTQTVCINNPTEPSCVDNNISFSCSDKSFGVSFKKGAGTARFYDAKLKYCPLTIHN